MTARGRTVKEYHKETAEPLGTGPWAGFALVDADGCLIGWNSRTPRLYAAEPPRESLREGWSAVGVSVTLTPTVARPRPRLSNAEHGFPLRCDSCGLELSIDCPNHCANAETSVAAKPGSAVAVLAAIAKMPVPNGKEPRAARALPPRSMARGRILDFLHEAPEVWRPLREILAVFGAVDGKTTNNLTMCVMGCVKRGELERQGTRGSYVYRPLRPLHPGRPM